MLLVSQSTFDIIWNLDYFSIKKVESNKNVVNVIYNQIIDNKKSCGIKCENEDIAKKVAQFLNEESISNKEDILEL